jgi:UDP:flavonoid glycosyltransferase YjiC (YdhE family)
LRVLLATVGSLGDLHPYIAVARALRSRGAQAVLASVPEYRADVEREGIEFASVGPGFAPFGDYQALLERIFDVRRGTAVIVRELVMQHLRTAYDDLSKAAEGADLLVSHPLTVTMPLIAEKRRLPWAATILSPLNLMSAYDPPLIAGAEWLHGIHRLGRAPYKMVFTLLRVTAWRWEAPLRAFRRSLGLPPKRGLAMLEGQFSPHLNLALFDRQLATPQPDWPRNLRVTGAALHDGSSPDAELESFLAAGEPPLVFALGSSAVWVAGDFWHHAVEAAQALGRRAILVVGRDTRARLPTLPDRVRAFPYLRYSTVFPRAAAVIHQAGIGTLSQAMRSGRPQLIVPFAFDQPDNARRAAGLGIARVLPIRKLTAASLAREIAALLEGGAYGDQAKTLAADLSETDGAARAAQELLRIAPC